MDAFPWFHHQPLVYYCAHLQAAMRFVDLSSAPLESFLKAKHQVVCILDGLAGVSKFATRGTGIQYSFSVCSLTRMTTRNKMERDGRSTIYLGLAQARKLLFPAILVLRFAAEHRRAARPQNTFYGQILG